ncbi:transposase [Streptomyces sp. NPDC059874]|uniref:transposase n=1 Tax=Streptomyces sp. NPDC059874 TaxID=3346983 RepID=UPI0036588361
MGHPDGRHRQRHTRPPQRRPVRRQGPHRYAEPNHAHPHHRPGRHSRQIHRPAGQDTGRRHLPAPSHRRRTTRRPSDRAEDPRPPGPGPERGTRHSHRRPGHRRHRAQPRSSRRVRGRPDTAAQLLVTAGGNPDRLRTEASFAALCGVAPVPASSGRTNRHRLSRGGDRGANSALHRIALVRMSSDARTREYVARQTTAGRTKKEIIRLLKRAIAWEIFRYLTTPVTVPDVSDLRPARQAKNITLSTVAEHCGVWPAVISCIERGTRRDDDLANSYRDWLTAA